MAVWYSSNDRFFSEHHFVNSFNLCQKCEHRKRRSSATIDLDFKSFSAFKKKKNFYNCENFLGRNFTFLSLVRSSWMSIRTPCLTVSGIVVDFKKFDAADSITLIFPSFSGNSLCFSWELKKQITSRNENRHPKIKSFELWNGRKGQPTPCDPTGRRRSQPTLPFRPSKIAIRRFHRVILYRCRRFVDQNWNTLYFINGRAFSRCVRATNFYRSRLSAIWAAVMWNRRFNDSNFSFNKFASGCDVDFNSSSLTLLAVRNSASFKYKPFSNS